MEFVDRCKAKGNLRSVQEEHFANDTVFSEEAKEYLFGVCFLPIFPFLLSRKY